jgi:hypothetical protein
VRTTITDRITSESDAIAVRGGLVLDSSGDAGDSVSVKLEVVVG